MHKNISRHVKSLNRTLNFVIFLTLKCLEKYLSPLGGGRAGRGSVLSFLSGKCLKPGRV